MVIVSIEKVQMYHTLDIAQLMPYTISIQDNGGESFIVHSSIIIMKWKYNHINPLGAQPSLLVQHKDYWKHEPTLVQKVDV